MAIPEPFTPVALTAGIVANLATDILKHHAQALDGTLAGRMLKRAGLIEPNFHDRMRDTLAGALELYFKTHPEYKLSGVMSFFRDPKAGRLVGGYILDRKLIDEAELDEALKVHFGAEPITVILMQQQRLDPKRIMPDFLDCYRRVLNEQLGVPQIALLLAMLDQTDASIAEIRGSEERVTTLVEQVQRQLAAQQQAVKGMSEDLQAIKQHLGMDRPQAAIAREINAALAASPRGAMFETGGLCSGYLLRAMPERYFVAQEFSPAREDLRGALAEALAGFNVQPLCADDTYAEGHILCKISALIQSTPFGVFQLTASQNRNVYLELGIAIGLGRPFVLVKEKDAEVSSLAHGLDYYGISSYLELRYELGTKVKPFLAEIAAYRPQTLPPAGSQRTAVIAHGDLDVIDFCVPMAKMLHARGLTPVILGDPTGKLSRYLELEKVTCRIVGPESSDRTRLDATVAAIQAARFGVYRIEKVASADTFLALGISMGLGRPGALLHKTGLDQLPSDVRGLRTLSYSSYKGDDGLEKVFPRLFSPMLEKYGR